MFALFDRFDLRGAFDPDTFAYFPSGHEHHTTVCVAKGYSIHFLRTGDAAIWLGILTAYPDELAEELEDMRRILGYELGHELYKALEGWYRTNAHPDLGPPEAREGAGPLSDGLSPLLTPEVDWRFVAEWVREEIRCHRHRAADRVIELTYGRSVDQVKRQWMREEFPNAVFADESPDGGDEEDDD